MLKQIFSKEFKKRKIQLEHKRIFSSEKAKKKKMNNNPSFKSLKSSSNKKIITKKSDEPLLEYKLNLIIDKPDYLTPQNEKSTLPTTTIDNLNIYSNEIIKKTKTPKNEQLIQNKDNINVNNKIKESLTDINLKINRIINEKETNLCKIDNKKDEVQLNLSDSKTKTKPETNLSSELNLSILSAEGIKKIKLLEDYIAQIKQYSSFINENKIQELQKLKKDLENNIKILSKNINLNKKKYKDNIKQNKNFEFEKEKKQNGLNKGNKDELSLKELDNLRVEIDLMKNQITQIKEETKGINDYKCDIERQTNEIKEELKKVNVKITMTIKGKEKISNDINSIQKKIITLRNKIEKSEKSANEFLINVQELVKLTKENFS